MGYSAFILLIFCSYSDNILLVFCLYSAYILLAFPKQPQNTPPVDPPDPYNTGNGQNRKKNKKNKNPTLEYRPNGRSQNLAPKIPPKPHSLTKPSAPAASRTKKKQEE